MEKKKSFDQYGVMAKSAASNTLKSGRYEIQSENEPYLVRDIIEKLDLKPSDRFLDIGCGVGNLLIPLSFMVAHSTGIDQKDVIRCFKARFKDKRVTLVATDFLKYRVGLAEKYEKILINSVVSILPNEKDVLEFVSKAAELLAPGGRLLVSDIPNVDKKARFLDTKFGKRFLRNWNKRIASLKKTRRNLAQEKLLTEVAPCVELSDKLILRLLEHFRRPGWEAFILPQSENLPFGYTREDLLITRLME